LYFFDSPLTERGLANFYEQKWPILLSVQVVTIVFGITRILFHKYFAEKDHKFLSLLLGIVSASYGFILGFIIISLWEILVQSKIIVVQEASHLGLLTQDSFAFPLAIQNELLHGIGQYIKHVINDEWVKMSLGLSSSLVQDDLNNLYHTIQSYIPKNAAENWFYNDVIAHLNGIGENRTLRLNQIDSMLISPIRFVMIFGLILISFFFSLYKAKNEAIHLISILVVTSIFAFNVGLALALDYPFADNNLITTQPYTEGILSRFNTSP
jgi:hypothetical protein